MSFKLANLESAAALETARRWAELLAFAQRWSVEEPQNLFAWQAMGDALRKLGRTDESVLAYRNGLEVASPSPIEFFGRSLSAGPLWYRLAQAHSDLGNMQESIAAFHKAADHDPEITAIWNDLGVAYSNVNDYKGAFTSFKKAVNLNPNNPNSLKNLGIVYAICGVTDGVDQIYSRLLKLDERVAREFIANAHQLLAKS